MGDTASRQETGKRHTALAFLRPGKHTLLILMAAAGLLLSWTQMGRVLGDGSASARSDQPLPIAFDGHFATAGTCQVCHGSDTTGVAMVAADGTDVNPIDGWLGSMMAHSARDPFWRAKVAHEMASNPAHAAELQDLCTSCHAPMGHTAAFAAGALHYGLADLENDDLGLDGVSCGACHQQSAAGLGDRHTGKLAFDSTGKVFGPYGSPLGASMSGFFGGLLEPAFGSHVLKAEFCATCHSLVTETVTPDGVPTGGQFVEQATWHEWENSAYPAEAISCQGCHMPRIPDPVILSSMDDTLPPRSPFGLHELAGANSFMLKLMRDNIDTLDIPATYEALEAGRQAAERMLRLKTLSLFWDAPARDGDSLNLGLILENRAGHKFPSGYPARRAFVELLLVTDAGDTLFHNGAPRGLSDPLGVDSPYEAHHALVRRMEDVPVYQMVPANTLGAVTTVLEQAAYPLKDNRLPPKGFLSSHPDYDTTAIVGRAVDDPDFNRTDGTEGSGGDRILYRIGLDGYRGASRAVVRVWYQAVPRRWTRELFAVDHPNVDLFEDLYHDQDGQPSLVAADTLAVPAMPNGLANLAEPGLWQLGPIPAENGRVHTTEGPRVQRAWWYAADGRMLEVLDRPDRVFALPGEAPLYLLRLEDAQGRQATYRILQAR